MKYLIDFKDQTTTEQISQWLDYNKITTYKMMDALNGVCIVECASLPAAVDIIESITLDENVSNKLLNTVEVIPQLANESGTFDHDAEWWKTASAYQVNFDGESTTFEKRGSKTAVYVVDSGVNASHAEFNGADIVQLFSFNGNFDDTNGHGTAIASVISGKTLGITSSTIKSVKIFDSSKTTMTSDIVSAIDAILQDILANQNHISVVNMSWTITKDAYIESKIQELIDGGAFVVVAAGNDGTPIQNVTPASMESVITVGAFDDNLTPANFSNYTSDVKNSSASTNAGALDCWAPGVNIGAALVDGTNGTVAGTSIAAAIVSACIAYNSDSLYSNIGITAESEYFLNQYTFIKKNLLKLDGKYSDSVNVISSFTTQPLPTWTKGQYTASRIAYDNVDMHGFLVSSAYVSKVELDGDLPDGLSLSNGWLVGRLAKAPDSTTELHYVVTVTFNDGQVNTFNLTLFLAKAGTAANNSPSDIQLQSGQGTCSGTKVCGSVNCSAYCTNCDAKGGYCPCGLQCN